MIERSIAAGWYGVTGERIDDPIWQGAGQAKDEYVDGLLFALAFRAAGLLLFPWNLCRVRVQEAPRK